MASPMKTFSAAAMAFGALVFASTTEASAQAASVVAGTLTCQGSGSLGLIVGSRQRLACIFAAAQGGPEQRYQARITRVGLDIGVKGPSVMIWSVITHTTDVPRGALAGRYVGVSANAAAGVGAGANVLVGGSRNAFSLQPLSVQAQTGVNIAAGVAGLRLTYRK